MIAPIAVTGWGSLFATAVTRRLVEQFARRARTVAPGGLEALTDRESEVLRFVARGLSNAEIATNLFVRENTAVDLFAPPVLRSPRVADTGSRCDTDTVLATVIGESVPHACHWVTRPGKAEDVR